MWAVLDIFCLSLCPDLFSALLGAKDPQNPASGGSFAKGSRAGDQRRWALPISSLPCRVLG